MVVRPALLSLLVLTGLAACSVPIPGLPYAPKAPMLSAGDYVSQDPLPAGQTLPSAAPASSAPGPSASPIVAEIMGPSTSDPAPFIDQTFQTVTTKTKYKPQFTFSVDGQHPNAQPAIIMDIYQTARELEVKEIRALIERSTFRYDKLKVGLRVGGGQMDVGTPPKASLAIDITCAETDGKTYGLFKAMATSTMVDIYLSDIKIQDDHGNLQVISVSNFARGNNHVAQHTTDYSARVRQQIDPGFILLSSVPGELRSRIMLYSEGDPQDGGKEALTVVRQAITLTP